MAKDKGNGKGNEGGVRQSAFLVSVDPDGRTAQIARLPYGVLNPDGAVFYENSEDAVKAIAKAAVAVFEDERVQKALLRNAMEQARSFRNGPAFETQDINLDDILERKTAKPKPKPVETAPPVTEPETEAKPYSDYS